MGKFKAGQRVKVEVEGVIPKSGDGCMASFITSGEYETYGCGRLYVSDLTNLKVTLAHPKDWPPRVGDIWEAEGDEYFARQNMASHPDELVVSPFRKPSGDYTDYYHRDLDDFKALNPVLVRRRGR